MDRMLTLGFKFQRRLKQLPEFWLAFSKSGTSSSGGVSDLTINSRGSDTNTHRPNSRQGGGGFHPASNTGARKYNCDSKLCDYKPSRQQLTETGLIFKASGLGFGFLLLIIGLSCCSFLTAHAAT